MNKSRTSREFSLDQHVPAGHLVRRIDAVLDLSFVRPLLAPHYSSTGRPSIDPELMLRMLLVGYLYGIRVPSAGSATRCTSTSLDPGSVASA